MTGIGFSRPLVLLAGVALLLAGCGDDGGGGDGTPAAPDGATTTVADPGDDSGTTGGGSGGGSDAPGDPCALLDTDAFEALTGGSASVGRRDEVDCRYDVDTGDLIPPSLSVSVLPGSSPGSYDIAKGSRPAPEDLDGIGDAAYYEPSLMVVQFLAGDTVVSVQLVGGDFDDATVRDFVVDEAATVASRL